MKKRDIPKTLKQLQSIKREETINKIQNAIDQIKDDGGIVTKKKLYEITGFSSSTFSKEHVKQLLKQNQVCQYKKSKQIETEKRDTQIEQLFKQIEKIERERNLLKSKLQDKEIALSKLEKSYNELEDSYRIILGKLHLIMKKLDILGIDMDID